eukprot:SAG11_NODE_14429_length_612_cov_0.867446_1_plen_113_part_00
MQRQYLSKHAPAFRIAAFFLAPNLLAPHDLHLAEQGCVVCHVEEAPKQCTACKQRRYCSQECASADWKGKDLAGAKRWGGHKAQCDALCRAATKAAAPPQPKGGGGKKKKRR